MTNSKRWRVSARDAYDSYDVEFNDYEEALEHYEKMVDGSKASAKLNELRDFSYPTTDVFLTEIIKHYDS